MTKTELETIEETHALGYATYYSEDGSREVDVEVCTHCEENAGFTTAARFPCETLEDAQQEYEQEKYEQEKKEEITCIDCLRPQCLACLEPVEKCSTPTLHEFLHTNRALHNKREINTINTADTVSERD